MDDNTDPDLAAAMGFAAFGSSKGSRKFDGRLPKDFGTDANRIDLGPRKRQAGLDEDSDPRKRRAEHHDMGTASKTAYTSDDPTGSNDAEMVTAQSGMTATTPLQEDGARQSASSIGGHSSVPAKSPEKKKKKETVPTGLAAFLARAKALPEKPSTGPSNTAPDSAGANIPTTSLSKTSNVQNASTLVEPDLQALRNGIRNEDGDIAYFLPSFIEDPWVHLEKGKS